MRATNGAWQVICVPGTENCAIQQIGKSPQGEEALLVRIRKVNGRNEQGETFPAVAEILAPLGVFLPGALRVQIDGGEIRATGFAFCLAEGCLAQDSMSDAFIADLKKGNTAKVLLIFPGRGEIAINISLSGFTKSFNSIQPVTARRQ